MAEGASTILIVDDEATNRLLFESQLKKEGYTIMTAASGKEALQFIERQLPDLILLDVMMPGISGFDVAEKLKSDERTRAIPIIMVTALDDREARMTALSKGAEEFLSKPVDRTELIVRVRNLLKLKKFQDALIASSGVLREQVAERSIQLAQANSDLGEAQAKLLQSEKLAAIGQLAAGVAHEINNPIGYVQSNISTLEKYFGDLLILLDAFERIETVLPEDFAGVANLRRTKQDLDLAFLREDIPALISDSKEGISRVGKIVQDLKAFSRIDANPIWEWADLREGLDSTLNVAANEIKYKAEVIKDYGDIPKIECMPSRLNQVFLNLMVNSAQAMSEDKRGTITLRTRCDGDTVHVEVSDTGCGISPQDMKRVFDPFFTTKPIGKGTGLGLSLSYGIVNQHAGHIEVESQLGQGTTFRIKLPIRHPAVESTSSPQ